MEDLEKAADGQGISYEDFKQNMKKQIITQQVISREVGSRMNVARTTMQVLRRAQEPDRAAGADPAKRMLISTEKQDKSSPADDPELRRRRPRRTTCWPRSARERNSKTSPRKNSDGPTAAQGGDLGYFKRGTLAKELEDKTFAMKPGEVSDVIRTKQGFVILKVVEHQQAGVPPFNHIEAKVQEAMYMQKLQPALRAYLQKLREEAYIDIKPGYVDTGASPNQTKPVETSAKEASAKELKKKKKKLGIF